MIVGEGIAEVRLVKSDVVFMAGEDTERHMLQDQDLSGKIVTEGFVRENLRRRAVRNFIYEVVKNPKSAFR